MTFEELQRQEIERLNNALVSQSLQPEDRKLLNQKMFNPKTGELQLFVDNGKGGVKIAAVNIFEKLNPKDESLGENFLIVGYLLV